MAHAGQVLSGNYTGVVKTWTYPFSKNVPAGRLLVGSVLFEHIGSLPLPTLNITDTQGNTWRVAAGATSAGSNTVQVIYAVVENTLTTADSLTIVSDLYKSLTAVTIQSFDDFFADSPLDVTATNSGSGGSLSIGPSSATSSPNQLVVAAFGFGLDRTFTAGSGYTASSVSQTETGVSPGRGTAIEWMYVGSTGQQSATASMTPSGVWSGVLATFAFTPVPKTEYDFRVDWEGTGDFLGTSDTVTDRVLARTPVQIRYGRDQARALSPLASGSAELELNNESRDYSPENSSSPIYGNVIPARPIRIRARNGSNTHTLFHGFIDEFDVLPGPQQRSVRVTAVDGIAMLRNATISTRVYESIRTGAAIHAVLDEVGWPKDKRDIDPGSTLIRYWWEENTDAFTAVDRIVGSEGPPALVTIGADGEFIFRDRHHRLTSPRSITKRSVLADSTYTPGASAVRTNLYKAPIGPNVAATTGWTATDATVAQIPGGIRATLTTDTATDLAQRMRPESASYFIPVTAGTSYTIQAEGRSNTSAGQMKIGAAFYDESSTFISTLTGTASVVGPEAWSQLEPFTVEAPANATQMQILIGIAGTGARAIGDFFDVRKVIVEQGVLVRPWFDGDSEEEGKVYAWSGTPQDSTSTETVPEVVVNFSPPLVYDAGWRDIVNSVTIQVEERVESATRVTVWEAPEVISILNGETKAVYVQTDDPFTNARTPVEGIDYQVVFGNVEVSLSRNSGQSAVIYLKATGGAAQVQGLKLAANPITVARTLLVTAEDPVSIAKYGLRTHPNPQSLPWACKNDAEAVAQLILAQRSERLPTVTVTMTAADDRLEQMLSLDLSDRVRIYDSETGLDRDFYIEQIEHTISEAGKFQVTKFGCEAIPTVPKDVFVLDVSTLDEGNLGMRGFDEPDRVFKFGHPIQGKFGVGFFAH